MPASTHQGRGTGALAGAPAGSSATARTIAIAVSTTVRAQTRGVPVVDDTRQRTAPSGRGGAGRRALTAAGSACSVSGTSRRTQSRCGSKRPESCGSRRGLSGFGASLPPVFAMHQASRCIQLRHGTMARKFQDLVQEGCPAGDRARRVTGRRDHPRQTSTFEINRPNHAQRLASPEASPAEPRVPGGDGGADDAEQPLYRRLIARLPAPARPLIDDGLLGRSGAIGPRTALVTNVAGWESRREVDRDNDERCHAPDHATDSGVLGGELMAFRRSRSSAIRVAFSIPLLTLLLGFPGAAAGSTPAAARCELHGKFTDAAAFDVSATLRSLAAARQSAVATSSAV